MRIAGNGGLKNNVKNHHLGTIAQLCRAVSSQLRHVSIIGKNLSSSNPHVLITCENSARDTHLWAAYIPHFDQISVKISVLGILYPYRCTDGGEIWHAKLNLVT